MGSKGGYTQLICCKDLRHHPFLWFPYSVRTLVYCFTVRTRHVAHSVGMFDACLIKAGSGPAVTCPSCLEKAIWEVLADFSSTQKSKRNSTQRLNKNINLRLAKKNKVKRINRWYSRNKTKSPSGCLTSRPVL